MVWELEYSDKEFSIQARLAKGLPEPEWVQEEPIEQRGDDFYLTAFYQLSSDRQFGGNAPGPIPWSSIVQYADRRGLDPDVSIAFEHIIRAIDDTYIKWACNKIKKETPKGKKGRKQ